MSNPPPVKPLKLGELSGKMRRSDIRFDFEDFLEDVEEVLPEGIDSNYYSQIKTLQNPLRNITKLPKALATLPINALLFQPLSKIVVIYLIPILISSPMMYLSIIASQRSSEGNAGTGIVFTIITIIGLAVVPLYLKNLYTSFMKMIDNKNVLWLTDGLNKLFTNYYNQRWPKTFFRISFLIPLLLEAQLVTIGIYFNSSILLNILYILLTVIGHIGMSLVVYANIMTLYFVQINTRLYIELLNRITERVKGYTDGHETILTQNTYEVVKVLADSPGLTVENLGTIPLLSFFTTVLLINSAIFLLGGPVLSSLIESYATRLKATAINIAANDSKTGSDITKAGELAFLNAKEFLFTLIFITAFVISLILSLAQIYPIINISNTMVRFRVKALTELDPYIYEDLTKFALGRNIEEFADSTTLNLFILRQYIGGMKTRPVSLFKLVYFSTLFLIYSARVVPSLVRIFA